REQLRRELESALGRPLGLEPGSVVVDGEPYRDFQLRFPEGPSGLSPELLSILEFCFYRVDPQVGVTDLDLQKMKFVRGADGDGERIFVLSNLTHGTYRLQAYLNDARSGPASRWYPLLGSTFQFVVDLRPPRFRVVFANEQIVDHPDRTAATFDEDVGFALVPDPDFVGDIAKAFVRDVTRDARASKAASGSSVAIPSAESSPPVFEILDPSKGRIPLPRAGRDYQFEVWALDAAGNESERKLVEIRRNRLEMNLGVGEVRGRTAEITGTLRYEGDDRACPALEFWVNGNPAAVAPGGELRFLDRVRTNDGLDSSMPFSVKLLLPSIENTIEARYRSKESASRSFAKKAIIEGVAIPVPEIVLEEPISSTTRQRTVRFAGRVRPYFHGLEFRIEHHGKLARQIELRMMGDEA
ncbi:MAG TPA: hypothetical protein VK116_00260, partial [Planctomycetota bacterium]|nr:hypothetical protein [Planctomycetota bacterium]